MIYIIFACIRTFRDTQRWRQCDPGGDSSLCLFFPSTCSFFLLPFSSFDKCKQTTPANYPPKHNGATGFPRCGGLIFPCLSPSTPSARFLFLLLCYWGFCNISAACFPRWLSISVVLKLFLACRTSHWIFFSSVIINNKKKSKFYFYVIKVKENLIRSQNLK